MELDMADNFDDLDDLDFGDMESDNLDKYMSDMEVGTDGIKPVKNDRKPLTSVLKRAGQGAVETVTDVDTLASVMVDKVMPSKLDPVANQASSIKNDLVSIYDEATKDIRPKVNKIVRSMDRIVPQEGKLRQVLNSTKERLGIRDESTSNLYRKANEEIAAEKASDLIRPARYDKASLIRSLLKDSADKTIQITHSKLLANIAASTDRAVMYQRRVTSVYQRKSLELQYRHLFIAKEQLEQFKQFTTVTKQQLEAVVKNTGLPDIIKRRTGEMLRHQIKSGNIMAFQEGLFGKGDYANHIARLIRSKVKNKLGGVMGGLDMLGDQLEMSASLKEAGVRIDPISMVGSTAAGAALGTLGSKLGEKLMNIPGMNSKVYAARAAASDLPEYLREKSTDKNLNKYLRKGAGFLHGLINTEGGPKKTIEGIGVTLSDPASYTNKDSISISEVIPGFLSKIHGEIRALRTRKKPVFEKFDYTRKTFVTTSELKSSITDRFVQETKSKGMTSNIDAIVEQVVKANPNMSDRDIAMLKKQLYIYITSGKTGGLSHLENNDFYKGLSKRQAKRLRGQINTLTSGDDKTAIAKNVVQFNEAMIRAKYSAPNVSAIIYSLVNQGYIDELLDLGIIYYNSETSSYDIDYKAYAGFMSKSGLKAKDVNGDTPQSKKKAEDIIKKKATVIRKTKAKSSGVGSAVYATLSKERHIDFRGAINKMAAMKSKGKDLSDKLIGEEGVSGLFNKMRPMGRAFADVFKHKDNVSPVLQAISTKLDMLKVISQRLVPLVYLKSNSRHTVSYLDKLLYIMAGKSREKLVLKEREAVKKDNERANKEAASLTIEEDKITGTKTSRTLEREALGKDGSMSEAIAEKLGSLGAKGLSLISKGASLAKRLTIGDKRLISTLNDIYIKGERIPVIRGIDMILGRYYDQETKKRIRTANDIQSQVVDKFGNVILSARDIAKGLVDSSGAKIIVGKFGSNKALIPTAFRLTMKTGKLPFEVLANSGSKGKTAYSFLSADVKHLFTGGRSPITSDIYIKGSKDPVIKYKDIVENKLFIRDTGEPLRYYNQLNSAIVDNTGNIVLGDTDTTKVMTDIKGRAVWRGVIPSLRTKHASSFRVKRAEKNEKRISKFFAKSNIEDIGDIYVRGETIPRLRLLDMKRGEYYDQRTGMQIRSLRNITGPVVDSGGNVIIDAVEIAKGLTNSEGRILPIGTQTKDRGQRNVFIAALIGDRKRIKRGEDLYVLGQKDPVLKYNNLKAGEYYTEDGKVIKDLSDIKGSVYDKDGNLVVDSETLSKGVVDKYGHTVRIGIQVRTNLVKRIFDNVRSILTKRKSTTLKLTDKVDTMADFVKSARENPKLAQLDVAFKSYQELVTIRKIMQGYGMSGTTIEGEYEVAGANNRSKRLGSETTFLKRVSASRSRVIRSLSKFSKAKLGKRLSTEFRKPPEILGDTLDERMYSTLVNMYMSDSVASQRLGRIEAILDKAFVHNYSVFDRDRSGRRDGDWRDRLERSSRKDQFRLPPPSTEKTKDGKSGFNLLALIPALLGMIGKIGGWGLDKISDFFSFDTLLKGYLGYKGAKWALGKGTKAIKGFKDKILGKKPDISKTKPKVTPKTSKPKVPTVKKSGGFFSSISDFFGDLKKKAGDFIDKGKKVATKYYNKAIDYVAPAFKRMGKWAGGLMTRVSNFFGDGIIKRLARKVGSSGLGTILKKVPGVGAITGLVMGAAKAMKGNWRGALMDVASGLVSIVPGAGTGLSLAIDAMQMGMDYNDDLKKDGTRPGHVRRRGRGRLGTVLSLGAAVTPGLIRARSKTGLKEVGRELGYETDTNVSESDMDRIFAEKARQLRESSKVPNNKLEPNLPKMPTETVPRFDTTNKAIALRNYRMAQYGIPPMKESNIARVRALEMYALRYVKKYNNLVSLEYTNLNVKNVRKVMGLPTVSKGNPEYNITKNWIDNRFIPIFIEHVSALESVTGKISDPEEASKLTGPSLDMYADSAWVNDEILNHPISIFKGKQIDPANLDRLKPTKILTGNSQNLRELEKFVYPNKPINKPRLRNRRRQLSHRNRNIDIAVPQDLSMPNYAESELKSFGITTGIKDTTAKPSVGIDSNQETKPSKVPIKLDRSNVPNARGIPILDTPLYSSEDGEDKIVLAKQASNNKPANIDLIHPAMRRLFLAMANEYYDLTGKKIIVNSGFRTVHQQRVINKGGDPYRSMHIYGLAIDIQTENANELEELGLMRKYGFTRPLYNYKRRREPKGETWHIEPAGIQGYLSQVKHDKALAASLINRSPGSGGGGWALVGKGNHWRNTAYQQSLWDKSNNNIVTVKQVKKDNKLAKLDGNMPKTLAKDQIAKAKAKIKRDMAPAYSKTSDTPQSSGFVKASYRASNPIMPGGLEKRPGKVTEAGRAIHEGPTIVDEMVVSIDDTLKKSLLVQMDLLAILVDKFNVTVEDLPKKLPKEKIPKGKPLTNQEGLPPPVVNLNRRKYSA